MPQEQNFAADPTVTEQEGWKIEDGGMERESTDAVARTLSETPDGEATPESPAPETPAETPSPVTTAPADEDGNVEADASRQDATTPKPDAAPAPKKRTLSGRASELQRQVDELTARKYQLQRELSDLDRSRPAAPVPPPAAAATTPATPAAAQRTEQDKPVTPGLQRPMWSEFEEAGKSWDEFQAAQADYLEQRIEAAAEGKIKVALERELASIRETSERQAHEARIDAEHKARMRVVRDAHAEEWPQILDNLKDVEVSPFIEDVVRLHPGGAEIFYELGKDPDAARVLNSFEWTNTMFDAIMASKNPSAMLLHLAEDNGEFERIRQMPPAAALYALGALSVTLAQSAQARDNGSRPRGTQVSKAPAPIRPVGSVSAAPSDAGESEDGDDFLSWVQRENKRDRDKAGRFGA